LIRKLNFIKKWAFDYCQFIALDVVQSSDGV